MRSFNVQAPAGVVMVRPHRFTPNPETEADNTFQSRSEIGSAELIAARAYAEVTAAADALGKAGVAVHLFEDEGTDTPDSVFPNNWFSTHAGGHVALYPMYSRNRRKERRADIIDMLKDRYRVQDVIDYSGLERDGIFLEGTGAMVLDHVERLAYAARSNRANEIALERFCTHFNFEPFMFDADDARGQRIYHTNVLMCIGSEIVLVGLDCIRDEGRRDELAQRLSDTGRTVVNLSQAQIDGFAGNALEVRGSCGPLLALSSRALAALTPAQVAAVECHLPLLPLDIPTLELAGGSVRCMLAGIHLTSRGHAPKGGSGPVISSSGSVRDG